jgi:hypothetical protein
MKNITKNLAALIKVKTIVTFVVIVVYAVLALRGNITPENVQNLTMVVVAFYFGTQLDKGNTEQISDHSVVCPFMTDSTESEESTEEGAE